MAKKLTPEEKKDLNARIKASKELKEKQMVSGKIVRKHKNNGHEDSNS